MNGPNRSRLASSRSKAPATSVGFSVVICRTTPESTKPFSVLLDLRSSQGFPDKQIPQKKTGSRYAPNTSSIAARISYSVQ